MWIPNATINKKFDNYFLFGTLESILKEKANMKTLVILLLFISPVIASQPVDVVDLLLLNQLQQIDRHRYEQEHLKLQEEALDLEKHRQREEKSREDFEDFEREQCKIYNNC